MHRNPKDCVDLQNSDGLALCLQPVIGSEQVHHWMSAGQFQWMKNDSCWQTDVVTDLGQGAVPFVTSQLSEAACQSFTFRGTLPEKLQSKTHKWVLSHVNSTGTLHRMRHLKNQEEGAELDTPG